MESVGYEMTKKKKKLQYLRQTGWKSGNQT